MVCVDDELLAIMKKAGCRAIYYGIETGSERMQEITKKKLSLTLFNHTLKRTLELDMMPTVSFITGYPEETKADADDTLDLLGSVYFLNYPIHPKTQLHLLTPEPGTALMNSNKSQMAYDNYITDFNFPTLDDVDDRLMHDNPEIFMNHHYYKAVLPRSFHICTSSLYGVIAALEKTIMRHLLGHYQQQLHLINEDVYEWLMRYDNASTGEVTIPLFLIYLGEKFGKDSMLYSLVVYQFEIYRLYYEGKEMIKTKQFIKPAATGRKKDYHLAPNIKLVTNIHKCPEIIERLEQGKNIGPGLNKKKTNMVLQLWDDDGQKGTIRNFEVNEFVSELLHRVETKELAGIPVSTLKLLHKQGFLQNC
jgi:hypothetical protein